MNSRKQKIEFLKGLQTGQRSIDEINERDTIPLFLVLFKASNDDFFTETDTENKTVIKKWSNDEVKEFEAMQEKRKLNRLPFTNVIRFIAAERNSNSSTLNR